MSRIDSRADQTRIKRGRWCPGRPDQKNGPFQELEAVTLGRYHLYSTKGGGGACIQDPAINQKHKNENK